jgi:hypothetical protein
MMNMVMRERKTRFVMYFAIDRPPGMCIVRGSKPIPLSLSEGPKEALVMVLTRKNYYTTKSAKREVPIHGLREVPERGLLS